VATKADLLVVALDLTDEIQGVGVLKKGIILALVLNVLATAYLVFVFGTF
jgi:hypothetical protein